MQTTPKANNYPGDKIGDCEDWWMASDRGVTNAAALITEHCKD